MNSLMLSIVLFVYIRATAEAEGDVMAISLHFSKTSLDEPLDVHLCSYFHEQHCVTRREVIQT